MKPRPGLTLLLPVAVLATSCGGSSGSQPAASPSPTAADWPMYGHDTARTNYNKGDTTIGLGEVTLLTPRFRTSIGVGDLPSSSGPVVAGGHVFVGSSVGSGPNYFCIDASTGAVVWSANVGHDSFPGNVGIGSTAAVVDGAVYVGGGDAAFYALDAATGAVRWRHPMNDAPDAYAWSSPLVANGVVYVGMSARYKVLRSEIRALDAATGALRANQFLVPQGNVGGDLWNSLALSADGSRVLGASGNDLAYNGPYTRAMIAFDPVSLGFLDWHQEAVPDQDLDFGTTPVVFHDASGRNLVGANQKNGRFYAYDVTALRNGPVWVRATGTAVGVAPAYDEDVGAGGTLFILGDNGVLFGVDPATGTDRWPPVAVGFANGNIAVANGLVYTGGGAGFVPIVAADTGTLMRNLEPQEPGHTFSGVVVSGGVVYSVGGAYLNAWSATGTGPPPGANPLPKAALGLAVVPNPSTAQPSSTAAHQARFKITINETAGVGSTVNFVNLTLRDAASGAAVKTSTILALDAADIVQRAGSNRIPASGTLSFDMAVDYFLVSGGQSVTVSAAAQCADDNGHVVSPLGQAAIQ